MARLGHHALIVPLLAAAVAWAGVGRVAQAAGPGERPAANASAESPGPASLPVTAPATGPAAGPSSRPTTQPTTRPTTEPADLSTPKAALRAFATALHDGDADKLRRTVSTTHPAEDRMLQAMAEWAGELIRLHDVADEAFGDTGAAKFTGDTDEQFAQSLSRIDSAEVAVHGEKALVRYPGATRPEYELARSGQEWKIPMVQFSHGADPATLERRIVESNVQTRIIRELVGEIRSQKYKTADAASEAWRGKIMRALDIRTPTTDPSTKTGS